MSAAVRRMQEALEAQRRAQEEAERLAEEQRRKVGRLRLSGAGCVVGLGWVGVEECSWELLRWVAGEARACV